MATRKSQGSSGSSASAGGTGSNGSAGGTGSNGSAGGTGSNGSAANGRRSTRSTKGTTAGSTGSAAANSSRRRTGRSRTSEASAAGATARARIGAAARARGRAGSRPKVDRPDLSIAEPTVTATDDVLAASNAKKALRPDMPRVAWLRTQLQNIEAERAERLVKVAQLTLIAIVFITFVLQNAQGVNVHFLLFAINIRLIWVIFGCALLGGAAGYLIGRPDKSLRALFPEQKKPSRNGSTRRSAGV